MMKNTQRLRGFTLIELLVVIAIIGILASVVLASLNTAREKGRIASIQSSISSMRAQAELGVDNSGTYTLDLCNVATTGGLDTLSDSAVANGATAVSCGQNTAVGVRPSAWAYAVTLPGTTATYYCVDSTGFSGTVAAVSTAEVTAGYTSGDVVCGNG